jgi:hypothetical protein
MRFILSVGLMLALASINFAQTLTPRLGLSFSQANPEYGPWTYEPQTLPKIGFSGGIAIEFPLSDKFSLQPEILFLEKGFRIEDVFTDTQNNGYANLKDEIYLQVLELPVLLKYHFTIGTTRMYVSGGPAVSYILKGTHKHSESTHFADTPELNSKWEEKQTIQFGRIEEDYEGNGFEVADNQWDISLHLGVGVRLHNKVLVDLRYGHGFIELYEAHPFLNNSRENSRFRTLQLTVGVPINLF